MSDNIKNQDGFTLPELVISISLIGIISISILGAMTYYFANITRNNTFVEMTTDSQNLLRSTVEELRYGSGVRQTNTISDPNGPAGGWNTSNSNFVIVISVPAVDSANNYIIDVNTGDPFNNELVYFKEDTTLYRRKLANPAAVGNAMKPSCPAEQASDTCPADAVLIEHIKDMSFDLYDQDDNATSNPLLARSVKVNLAMERDSFGQPLKLDNSIRMTLRNTF